MRIGIYSPYLDILGGGEKYMLTAASALSTKHDVALFWNQEEVLSKAQEKFNIDLSRVNVVSNIFSEDVSTQKRFLQSKKFDAIFFLSDGSLPLVGTDLCVHFQFPVEWVDTKGFVNSLKIRRIKKIVCNSNYTKEHIDKKFNRESIVLYPPTYFKSKMPKVDLSQKQNIILNVGRYARFPNGGSVKKQEFMIEAFKSMYDKGLLGWQLYLVISFTQKEGEFVQSLKKSIGKYPIKIMENVSYKDLLEQYKKSKIYWHAAGVGEDLSVHPERAEHFGITTVEAMLNGLVPIVIEAGGQKEIVEEAESGFLWTNDIELIEKTFMVTNDQKLFTRISQNASKKAQQFSTDSFCQKVLNIFS
ncbi:MAG: glycosyltransferase [Candidatus Levybacteria bacterium]|nr:glycosyltransferase [Candidatus Levybacteria bacterium]